MKMFLAAALKKGFIIRFFVWCRDVFPLPAPVGYQDESGFHYGITTGSLLKRT